MEERLLKSSFGFSLLIHMSLFVLGAMLWTNPTVQQGKKLMWIELPKSPARARKDEDKDARIVRSREGWKAEEAAPDAFLGAETRKVQEQTVSKSLAKEDVGEARSREERTRRAGQEKTDLGKRADIGRLGVPMITPGQAQKPADMPQWNNPASSWGAVSQDYVAGLKESESSALNTREFVFFSYFERIRGRLDLAWGPILRQELIKMFHSGRRLASDKDLVTRTIVTLDRRGQIVKVDLVEESGIVSLDKAAVAAFNRAGPFPNPPTGLIGKEGTVQIRWDFVLKT